MYKIYQFSNPAGEGEFIVISRRDKDQLVLEWCDNDIVLDFVYKLKKHLTGHALPCDCKLQKVKL